MAQDMQDVVRMVQFALCNNVTKLNGANYTNWKRDIEIRLKGVGLWDVVTQDAPAPPVAAEGQKLPPPANHNYEQKSSTVLQYIYSSCEADQQGLIMDFTTAKDCWDFLKSVYENRTLAHIGRLWSELGSLKMHDDEKMVQYIARVKRVVRELKSVGENVPDTRWTNRLIAGLPRRYSILKVILRDRSTMAETECITVLLQEETELLIEETEEKNERDRRFRGQDRRPISGWCRTEY